MLINLIPVCLFSQQVPAAYPGNVKVNYVRTWTATAPVTDPAALLAKSLGDVKQTTQYLDGLGRPLQMVARQQSLPTGGTATDLVSPVHYDAFGRENLIFLPFAANNTGGNASVDDGGLKLNPFQQQAAFGQVQYPGETWYYSETVFEASPLSRVSKVMPQGNSWAGAGRGMGYKGWVNTDVDDVKIWTVSEEAAGLGTYSVTGTYAAGELFKNITEDEADHQVIEFKDKDGLLLLRKVQLTAAADNGGGSEYAGWVCTYYIYDDLGSLRAVIQPEAVQQLSTALNWTPNPLLLAEQCFRFAFDERNRLIRKKVPGAGEVLLVYDVRDRLVFFQDANMRAGNSNQWQATLYDGLNRPVITGLIYYSGAREALQQLVNTRTQSSGDGPLPEEGTGIVTDLELKSPTGSGQYYAYNSISMTPGFETTQGAAFTAEIVPEGTGGGSGGGSNITAGVIVNKNPLPSGTMLDVLTITYYDNLQWAGNLPSGLKDFNASAIDVYKEPVSNTVAPYAQAITPAAGTLGLVTGTKIKVLGSDPAQYLTTVNFYNHQAQLLQSRSQNYTGGINAVTNQYSWSGHLLVNVQEHQKAGVNTHTATVVTRVSYDDLQRVTKIKKLVLSSMVDAQTEAWRTIAEYKYDALGQVMTRQQGNKWNISENRPSEEERLTRLDYAYNIRGWLTAINKDYLTENQLSDRYFGMDLGYDKNGFEGTFANHQYNGNISGAIWKNEGDGKKRKYDFTYDAANRLTGAVFGQHAGGGGTAALYNTSAGVDFTVSNLTYDANGNIRSMWQKGMKGTEVADIDKLTYNYYQGTNKLQNVIDNSNDVHSQLGDFRSSQAYMQELGRDKVREDIDYAYDDNGNLVKDRNKNIAEEGANGQGIEYNHLNLPVKINVKNKGTIEYTYDAGGAKLKKTITDRSTNPVTVTTTLYLDGFEYKNDSLWQLGHEEGRIRFEKAKANTCAVEQIPSRLVYDYFIKDHLGNTRMVLTEEKDLDCYPAATVEPARVAVEKQLYNIVDDRIVNKTMTTEASLENKVYRTHGGIAGEKTGLEMVLKVMSGDKVFIRGESFYNLSGGNAGAPLTLALEELLAGFAGSGPLSGKGITVNGIQGLSGNTAALEGFLGQNNPGSTTAKAAINWILLDEQFRVVAADFDGVRTGGGYKQHFKFINTPVNVARNGYLYIFVSNESNLPVYFDNLQVSHERGSIMETTDYYPFGLAMVGVSAKALKDNYAENKYKANGATEFNNDFDISLYETDFRSYDPQIGRFHQIDFLATFSFNQSPYSFVHNNPISYIDPMGLDTIRGTIPEGFKPKQGDVFIPESGDAQIYDTERGKWAPQTSLTPVVVTPGNNNQPAEEQQPAQPVVPVQPPRGNGRGEPATNIPAGIQFGANANRAVVSQYSIDQLAAIMRASGNPNVTITSTLRTPEGQARAMYDNIASRGVAYNLRLYGPAGDQVVNVAARGQRAGLGRDAIISAMAQEIRRIGPGRVSRHTGDPNVINVLDISPRTIVNRQAFAREIRARGIRFFEPPRDPAFHLEIRQ
ncbi:MAG: DUF6443 domain-containing protein [Candidatus Pseudobacter hemicellulosilyticus]|uniref:DUF6443 domain-containing protein n=1 Tax=Candidatus Pseudobacter hemicellulosilyticus TaxID=3121375 RepID=A0AAJ5WTK1_9BACT|nr:MAG: DUF6443 domain-containing protein [Pseudobacter sp.]